MTIIVNFTSTVQILSVELKGSGIHDRFYKEVEIVGAANVILLGMCTAVTLLNPTGGIC